MYNNILDTVAFPRNIHYYHRENTQANTT